MQAGMLHSLCKITQKISNQSSLTPLYRSIELNSESVRCTSEFGTLQLKTNPLGITEPCLVDTKAVVAAASTLPVDSEITFSVTENRLNWKCGEAKGHFNKVFSDHTIPLLEHTTFPWIPAYNEHHHAKTLASALNLAASACQAQAVSVGLYGIVIEPVGESLSLMSSNSIALASVKIPKGTYPAGKITLRPPVPNIIAYLIEACPNCKLDVTPEGIFIEGAWLGAKLPYGVPLQHDLKEIADKYTTAAHTSAVNGATVARFITRARGLSDRHASFTIGLRVEAGKLALMHNGIAASTEEFFISEGLDPTLNFASIALPAEMIEEALPHIQTAVYDYLPASELVLRGTNPDFLYIVGGGEQ